MTKACCCFFCFQVLLTSMLSASLASAEESGDLVGLKNLLLDFRDKEGRAPTDVDLLSLAMKQDYPIPTKGLAALQTTLRQQNNPPLSKEALLKIIKAKRDSIRDFQCTYVASDTHLNNEEDSYSIECHYKMKDNMFFIDKSIHKHDGIHRQTFAYDGEYFFNYVPKPAENDKLAAAVSIHTEMNPRTFVDYHLPMYRAMLMDSEKFGITYNHTHDLVNLLEFWSTMVCEDTEMVNGQECVVVCNWRTRVWLSPELGFSPVKLERYRLVDHDVDGVRIFDKRLLIEQRDFHDFKDYGNGIWLPFEVNIEYFDMQSGAPSVTSTTTALSIEINSGLKKEDFTEFIPDGTIALDGPRDLIYEWGEHASIGSLVDDVATPKRKSNIWRTVSMAVGLLLIVIACCRIYRRRKLEGA